MVEDARKIAAEAAGTYFLDIALQAAEEALSEYYAQEWPFAVGEGAITTVAPYTTGTVTFTNGSQNVVGVGTTWLTTWPVPAVIRASGSQGEPFVVTAFNSATGLTIDRPFPFSSVATQTYTVEFPSYPIPEYIAISGVCCAQTSWQMPLNITSLQSILYNRARWTPWSYPYNYYLIPGDGTTLASLVLEPAPSVVQTIRLMYTKAIPAFRCHVSNGGLGQTASLAAAGTALTGVNTTWLKLGYSLIGQYFEVGEQEGIYSLISAVGSDTGATVGAWGGTTVAGSSYYISPQILCPDNFRPMLRDLMRWKYFQNQTDDDGISMKLAQQSEQRYRRNLGIAWKSVNRMRQDRSVSPVDIGQFGEQCNVPSLPWQLTMAYNTP